MNQVDSPSVYRTKVQRAKRPRATTIGADAPEERTPPEFEEIGAPDQRQASEWHMGIRPRFLDKLLTQAGAEPAKLAELEPKPNEQESSLLGGIARTNAVDDAVLAQSSAAGAHRYRGPRGR